MSANMHCPYNKNHQISEDKFIWHVTKCMKKNPHCKEIQCPYNPIHYCSPEQYQNHILSECEQKPTADQIGKMIEFSKTGIKKKDGEGNAKNVGEKKYAGKKMKTEGRKGGERKQDERRDKEREVKKSEDGNFEEFKVDVEELQGKEGFGLVKRKLVRPENKNEIVNKEREGDCQNSIF